MILTLEDLPQGKRVEFVIPKAEPASPFLSPLFHPAPQNLQISAGLELPYRPTGEFSPLFPPLWRCCIFTLVLSTPSSHGMTLGMEMALSPSRLVPARKPSACQAPTRHRRTSQSAREVLPFHGQSQNSHLIINHPD